MSDVRQPCPVKKYTDGIGCCQEESGRLLQHFFKCGVFLEGEPMRWFAGVGVRCSWQGRSSGATSCTLGPGNRNSARLPLRRSISRAGFWRYLLCTDVIGVSFSTRFPCCSACSCWWAVRPRLRRLLRRIRPGRGAGPLPHPTRGRSIIPCRPPVVGRTRRRSAEPALICPSPSTPPSRVAVRPAHIAYISP
jgi:hypothetical protein